MENRPGHSLPKRFEKYLKHKEGVVDRLAGNKLLIACQRCHSAELADSASVRMCHKCHVTPVTYQMDNGVKDTEKAVCSVAEVMEAVAWVKDQITMMKEEDKVLMQHFLDLRARIRKLKSHMTCAVTSCAPASGFSRKCGDEVSASHLGIDATENGYSLDLNLSPHQEEDYLGEFRDRTVSMHDVNNTKHVTLSTPRTIRKYRTEEYL